MQINNLKRRVPNKKSRQVGRGGTRGKTSGKGTKGQNARSGRKKRPEMRDVIKRLPKLRGRGKNSNKTIQSKPFVLNLKNLSVFKAGETVSPKTLTQKKVFKIAMAKHAKVKILGGGEIKVALSFEKCDVSESARKKILATGGSIK
jgi:large subunit ribosomal protein L15